MGLLCQIIKNKKGEVERIEAPNGQPSMLYNKALSVLGNEEQAMNVWAKAYTPGFFRYYGYWNNPNKLEEFNTDMNGEPLFEDVIAYMEHDAFIVAGLSKPEVGIIRNTLLSSGLKSINDLYNKVISFFKNGSIVINEENLRRSGMYTEEEMVRIMSDSSVRNKISGMIRRIASAINTYHDKEKFDYFFSANNDSSIIIYKDGEYDDMGKSIAYNPAEIRQDIANAAAGITDRPAFDLAIRSLFSYPELVEKYDSDPEFADSLYNEFSSYTKVPVVSISENGLSPTSGTMNKLYRYYHPTSEDNVIEIRKRINNALSLLMEDPTNAYQAIKDVERSVTWLGIDIIGLSDIYSEKYGDDIIQNIEDLLLDIDILASRSDLSYFPSVSVSIDTIFGDSTASIPMKLPSNIGQDIVYLESSMPEVDLFNNYGLLKIGYNLYHKVGDVSEDSLYDSLAKLAKVAPGRFNASMFPPKFFKDGKLNTDKINKTEEAELRDIVRKYVISKTDSSNPAKAVASRLAFGHSLSVEDNVDIQREYDLYKSTDSHNVNQPEPFGLYDKYLSAKLNNTDEYNSALKYLDFNSGAMRLSANDLNLNKQIELGLSNATKKSLWDYVANSADPALNNLFFLNKNEVSDSDMDFKSYLYAKHPSMLKDSAKDIEMRDGYVFADGKYDSHIRVGGDVMIKIGESNGGSLYKSIQDTSTTNVSKIVSEKEGSIKNVIIEQNFSINTNESKRLTDELECN